MRIFGKNFFILVITEKDNRARPPTGYHNVAESFYGTPAWDVSRHVEYRLAHKYNYAEPALSPLWTSSLHGPLINKQLNLSVFKRG